MAPIEPERVLKIVEPLFRRLVAAVCQPSPRLQQHCRTKEAIAVPPMARAAGRAAEAQDALVIAVELAALLRGLQPFLLRFRRFGVEPRLDRGVLCKDVR